MMPLISIIMPVYNAEEYIEEAIKSVLNQTYSNWELILVDDCSTDNSCNVIQKYLLDARIKFLEIK
ncbi:Putative lipooligosaccharide biosynthesis protein [Actinobacillus equuli]|nr:Putative lipooligosaccharide biosynthesis protein [Actinobacillus equuli]